MEKIAAIVLAGGKGTRMKSNLPKVLHKIGEYPMIYYPIEKLKNIGIQKIVVSVSYKFAAVLKEVSQLEGVEVDRQPQPLGTAHAVKLALVKLPKDTKAVLVLNVDDSAFYEDATLRDFTKNHFETKACVSLITIDLSSQNEFGKIIRDKNGKFVELMEDFRYLANELSGTEINCGAYIFDYEFLKEAIMAVKINPKGELNITELANIAVQKRQKVNIFRLKKKEEWVGINTPEELKYANWLMKNQTK